MKLENKLNTGIGVVVAMIWLACLGLIGYAGTHESHPMYMGAIPGVPLPPAEIHGWAKTPKQTFILDPGAGRAWPVTAISGLVRYDIESDQPVNTGVVGTALIDAAFKDTPDGSALWRSFDAATDEHLGGMVIRCYAYKVLQAEQDCKLMYSDLRGMIMIRDTRSPQTTAAAIVGAVVGVREPLKNAVAQNRVTLTIYQWKCIQNCKDR